MRVYVCFDDTDVIDADRGTGKLARWFLDRLPDSCAPWGVVRQQLLVDPAIPYTSHNSSACVVIHAEDRSVVPTLIDLAAEHVAQHMYDGSDPGICVACEGDPSLNALVDFGRRAAVSVVSQDQARSAAEGTHLSGHGGTNDGIIGAAAGVGLTAWGWSGRFIEYGRPELRDWPARALVGQLEAAGMMVVPVERNVVAPRPEDLLDTSDWLRPRLWGGQQVVPAYCTGEGEWTAIGKRATARQ